VKVRFSIRDSIATGAIKYQETHNPTTSALGLFSVNVGMGTIVSGTFSGITWGKSAKFLQVELNITGGTTYIDLGTTQMMSVPYALQANAIKMKTSVTGDTLYTGGGNYLIVPGLSVANPILNQPEAPVTDIDGNVYQTVRIGSQVWMKENLKVSKYRNGDPITTGISNPLWRTLQTGAYAELNNSLYGKLYNWYAVNDTRNLCPVGFHVPTQNEWIILEINLGMSQTDAAIETYGIERGAGANVGGKLKSKLGWTLPNNGATDESGFSALAGGYRDYFGPFTSNVNLGCWWLATDFSFSNAYSRYLDWNYRGVFFELANKPVGRSVRCLKD
jgi:uncharacterized protein (TIGR02145 family)